MSKKVGLIVDNPLRDLHGLLLVARELVMMGHTAYIIPMYNQAVDVPLLYLDAVVINYARNSNKRLLQAYKQLGIAVNILDTEGGVVSLDKADSPENWAKMFKENGFNKLVDNYLFWGSSIFEAFQKYSGLSKDQLHLTGCPRYDFADKKWKDFFEYPATDFILINTNFSAINSNFSKTEEEEIEAFIKSGWEKPYVKMLLDDWKIVFENVMITIEKLLVNRPNEQFILRPHPFENKEYYIDRFSKFKNLRVITEGSVFHAIKHCSGVIHLNCGSSVESLLMNKVPINLEYLSSDIQRGHTPLPREISLNVISFDHLIEVLNDIHSHLPSLKNKMEEHIKPWFYISESETAAVRVAKFIKYSKTNSNRISILTSIKSCHSVFSIMGALQGTVANLFGSKISSALREFYSPERKKKAFSIEFVKNELNRIQSCDYYNITLSVESARHVLTSAPLSTIRIMSI